MLPADNHVHSQFSWDTGVDASMEEACRQAVQIGLPAIAFTEHVDFTEWGEHDHPAQDDRVLGSLHSIVHDGRLIYADRLLRTLSPDAVVRDYF